MGSCNSRKDNDTPNVGTNPAKEVLSLGKCAICLEELLVAEVDNISSGHRLVNYHDHDFSVMACGNSFHKNCIRTHYNLDPLSSQCPLCRSKFIVTDGGNIIEHSIRYDTPMSDSLQGKLDEFITKKIMDGTL